MNFLSRFCRSLFFAYIFFFRKKLFSSLYRASRAAPVRSQRECVFRCCVLKCRKNTKKISFCDIFTVLLCVLFLSSRSRAQKISLRSHDEMKKLSALVSARQLLSFYYLFCLFFVVTKSCSLTQLDCLLINKLSSTIDYYSTDS